ncbi:hypothetical protein Tco_1457723, partial [Tanacetum coccineum]
AFLEKFTFVMKHKTGVSNRATDALSRRSSLLVTMQAGEKLDFFLHDGYLFKGNQLCIPDSSLCLQIIKELHGEGHVGRDRTLQLVYGLILAWICVGVTSYSKGGVYRLHGLPSFIVSDWDTRSLGNLLRCLVGDHVKAWDQKVCQAEFAHNHAVNRSTGSVPKKVHDFVVGLHDVHKAVHENLVRANSKYKQDVDHKRRHVYFEDGDFVWAILTKDHFLVGEYNKLSAKKIGPLEIVEKINSNAYRLKLPSHISYPWGNVGGPNIEELADLFLESHDRVNKRDSVKQSTDDEQSKNPFGEDDDSSSDEQSGRRPRKNQREDNRRWESRKRVNIPDFAGDTLRHRMVATIETDKGEGWKAKVYKLAEDEEIKASVNMFDPMILSDAYQRALAFEKHNRQVRSSSSPAITGASGSGNVESHFVPRQAKAGGGNTGPVSRASGSSGLKCFNCGEPAYEEYKVASVYVNEPECEEEYVFGDVGVNLVVRRSCLTPKVDGDDWLKHNIFQSTCTISGKFEDEMEMGDDVFVLIGKEVDEDGEIPEAMIPLLQEFLDVFPDDLPYGLLPLHDI